MNSAFGRGQDDQSCQSGTVEAQGGQGGQGEQGEIEFAIARRPGGGD